MVIKWTDWGPCRIVRALRVDSRNTRGGGVITNGEAKSNTHIGGLRREGATYTHGAPSANTYLYGIGTFRRARCT